MSDEIKNRKKSPCLTCTKVVDPQSCEIKQCGDWRAWFVTRWDTLTDDICKMKNNRYVESDTITVGGNKYAHPNHIRRFLQNKPCDSCDYTDGQCEFPCSTLVLWETMKEKTVR